MISRHLCVAVCTLTLITSGRAVAQEAPPASVIDLSGADQVRVEDMDVICSSPGLTELHLDNARVDKRGWLYLAAARDLEVLTLAGAGIDRLDSVLDAIHGLPKLRRLDISRLGLNRKALENLVGMPALQELIIWGLDEDCAEVVSRIKGLKSLTVQRSHPGVSGWAALGELELDSLTILDTGLETDHVRFIAGMRSLKKLVLPGYSLPGKDYAKLARLPELKVLDVSGTLGWNIGATLRQGSGGVDQLALQEISASCTKLERLNITYCDITDFSCLKTLSNLKRLDAEWLQHGIKVTTLKEMLTGTTRLEMATLMNTRTDSEDQLLRAFRSLPQLKVLAVGGTQLRWSGSLTELDGQATLEELHVSGLRPGSPLDPGGSVLSFPKLPNLERANFYDCDLTDEAIADISSLPAVVVVSLQNCKLSGKRGIGSLDKNNTVQWLNLGGVDLKDKPLEGILNLQAVAQLDLSDTEFTGDMLSTIGQSATLRQLTLARCRIVDSDLKRLAGFPPLVGLSLAGTQITDRGLEHLAKLTKLERLSLAKTRITDEGVDQLAKLTNLKRLDVTGTRLTNDGLARLTKRLPSCKLGKYERESSD